jgi:hypothetical protein
VRGGVRHAPRRAGAVEFRAAITARVIAMFRSAVSDARTLATPSARDNDEGGAHAANLPRGGGGGV